PWISKEKGNERPMYEAEIALLRGNVESRFGSDFLDHVERMEFFFHKHEVDRRLFVVNTWNLLKNDAKAKKADGREPME
ncbi:deoxyribonuclease IV, partial [Bacillus sp. SIMBA_069]